MDQRPSPLTADHGVGLWLTSTTELLPWLRLRISALGRFAIPPGEAAPSNWGSVASAGLEGRY